MELLEACWVSARHRGFRQPVGRRWQSADSPRAGSRHHGAPGKEKLGLKKSSARRRHRGRADGAARASREELLVLPIREHMGRLRCPPTPSPPAHGPSARCWGAWKEPPRVGSPRPAARGEEQEHDVSDARHHHAQLRLLQHPRQRPCASRRSPCSSIPPRSWVESWGRV